MDHWDKRFVDMAKLTASWSKDPEVKVGAVIVAPSKRQISVGYNGLPIGFDDKNHGMAKQQRVAMTVHAELNAILNSMFIVENSTMYVTKAPCLECAKAIVQSRIYRVVCPRLDPLSSWHEHQMQALNFLRMSDVKVDILGEHDE